MITPRLVAALAAGALLVAACGGDKSATASDVTTGDSASAAPSDADCPPVEGAGSQTRQFDAAPPMCLDDSLTYQAIVTTNQGEFTIALDLSLIHI